MSDPSPFSRSRFEYEERNLYYLPKKVIGELYEQGPIYLQGSRGTGKTTLLKSLSWRERLANPDLRAALNDDVLAGDLIGIYIKVPEAQLQIVENWASPLMDEVKGKLLALYFDLVLLEEAAAALAEFSVQGILGFSASQEREAVAQIRERFPKTLNSDTRVATLRELSKIACEKRNSLETMASFSAPIEQLSDIDALHQIGQFGRLVASELSILSTLGGRQLKFKFCVDEGECMSEFQQLVVNTLVRTAKAPLSHVVSFVGPPANQTSTLFPNLTLQSADRRLLEVDEPTANEFEQLANGIASLRVAKVDPKFSFETCAVLGARDLDGTLKELLENSKSQAAKDYLESARNLAQAKGRESRPLPIREAYLREKLHLPFTEESPENADAMLRKRSVAAYLSLFAELGSKVRYDSGPIMLSVCDHSIRDFLGQMDTVFSHANVSLEKFLSETVSRETQHVALRKASKRKADSIDRDRVPSPKRTHSLVHALATITAELQRTSDGVSHLRTSERGVFVVDAVGPEQGKRAIVLRDIREASEAGFLRLKINEASEWRFRVHASLAPAYGFSYRGAYAEVKLTWDDLVEVCEATERRELEGITDKIIRRLRASHGETLPLFG